jgi:hypothetical protein
LTGSICSFEKFVPQFLRTTTTTTTTTTTEIKKFFIRSLGVAVTMKKKTTTIKNSE